MNSKTDNPSQTDGLNDKLPLKLLPLPFDSTRLGSAISAETLRFHHGQHHKAYIDKVNELTAESAGLQATTLEQLLLEISGNKTLKELENNALQCWNHQFQWLSLTEATDITQFPAINSKVEDSFRSIDELATKAIAISKAHFGSGWLWLVTVGDQLELITTHDAKRPDTATSALLVLDFWEHAYYLDHQNRKGDYIESVIRNHWNWAFAEKRLGHIK
jgi:superoxide dismutase, Fe-Mn family